MVDHHELMIRDEHFKFRNPFYVSPFKNVLEFFHLAGVHW